MYCKIRGNYEIVMADIDYGDDFYEDALFYIIPYEIELDNIIEDIEG